MRVTYFVPAHKASRGKTMTIKIGDKVRITATDKELAEIQIGEHTRSVLLSGRAFKVDDVYTRDDGSVMILLLKEKMYLWVYDHMARAVQPITGEDAGYFTWGHGSDFFVETAKGDFIWSATRQGGNGTLRHTGLSLCGWADDQGIIPRCKGIHRIRDYCKEDALLPQFYPQSSQYD